MSKLEALIATLKVLDSKQLMALFHDIDDINVVERIGECAYHFFLDYENQKSFEKEEREGANPTKSYSEYKEWAEQDYARRHREHESDKGRPY